MLADAEEAADAEHHPLDVSILVHQEIVDRAEALVVVIIDAEADELRRAPVTLERRRVRCRGWRHVGAIGGCRWSLRERNGRKQCRSDQTGRDVFC